MVGLDIAHAMLREARTLAAGSLVQADMRSLPFDEDAFDAIWASMSLLHLPREDLPGVLEGLRSVVPEGGHLYATLKAGDGVEVTDWQDGQRLFTYYRPDAFARALSEAGFAPTHDHVEPSETTSGQDILVHLARAGPLRAPGLRGHRARRTQSIPRARRNRLVP